MTAPQLSRTIVPVRTPADVRMRRLLRIPEDARRGSARGAERVFSASVLISGVRCLLTYVVLPLLGPVVGAAGDVGAAVGLSLSAVSAVAIVAAMRRFFRVDHRWRWRYTAVGAAILVFLAVQAVIDVGHLVG